MHPVELMRLVCDVLILLLLVGGLIVAILTPRTLAPNWNVAVSFPEEVGLGCVGGGIDIRGNTRREMW